MFLSRIGRQAQQRLRDNNNANQPIDAPPNVIRLSSSLCSYRMLIEFCLLLVWTGTQMGGQKWQRRELR